ncbi:MAG TPA: hypothetical protein VN112_19105 [Ensifer sp.]|nr:hypothetical protein [Ensifer sp.]
MRLFAIAPALLILAAAPGEPLPEQRDVVSRVDTALARRLGGELSAVQVEKVAPSADLPGFVACGRVSEKPQGGVQKTERFFAVVPGNFAVLDRDGGNLVDVYWKRYGC